MFGHQDDKAQSDNHIPDQEIDAALSEGQHDQNNQGDWGHPGTPLDDNKGGKPLDLPTPSSSKPTASAPLDTNTLLDIKQQALTQLAPLVSHLDQTPEEKFRTLMMMIQASDDQSKLNDAFNAAKQITDDKGRAQALLDIVNEINYFTQNQDA